MIAFASRAARSIQWAAMKPSLASLVVLCAAAFAACDGGDSVATTPDAAADVTPDVAADVTPDAAADVTLEAAADVTPDAAVDVSDVTDVVDAAAPVDAAVDAPADVAPPRDAVAYASCKAILDAGASTGDGVYTITVGGVATPVRCLMSVDGGGWTLVGNFPAHSGTAGVTGWTSGAAVGSSFTDLTRPFKLSDDDINALRTTGFRARGTATLCAQGPCSVDTTLFWRPTCRYASGSTSPDCYTAFRDVGFTVPESATAPCTWHWGLVAADCAMRATMGTSHEGDHVFAGNYSSYVHAYDARSGEDPSVQFWVR